MSSWHRIRLVFRRELLDQLRDRRTLAVLVGLPILLYLVLGVGLLQMAAVFVERPALIVVLGSAAAGAPPLVDNQGFQAEWTGNADADRLVVISDAQPAVDGATDPLVIELMEQVSRLVEPRVRRSRDGTSDGEEKPLGISEGPIASVADEVRALLAAAKVDVLVILPVVDRNDGVVADAANLPAMSGEADVQGPELLYNSADGVSLRASMRVRSIVNRWRAAWLDQELRAANFPAGYLASRALHVHDLATGGQRSANLWALLFPALIVIMTVIGAFYPAIDMCAGEKERGTLETLLICPATRQEIVIGKFLMVLSFSCSSAFMNLLSMALIGNAALSFASQGGASATLPDAAPSLSMLLWVAAIVVPVAAPFCGMSLALATFARTSKEAQLYLSPLMLVALVLTAGCLLPDVRMTPFYALLPVVGPTLWLKQLLSGGVTTELLINLVIVLAASTGYSLLAMRLAVEQFRSEELLLPSSEHFQPLAWLLDLLRERRGRPTPAMAGVCFGAIMLLQLLGVRPLAPAFLDAAATGEADWLWMSLAVRQGLSTCLPAILMTLWLTRDFCTSLRLRQTSWVMLTVAAAAAAAAHPLMLELSHATRSFFPELPAGVRAVMETINRSNASLAVLLAAFAFFPACCEELAFRGFMLTGFSSKGTPWLGIVLSSLLFGAMHILPQQAFNAFLLGLPLGYLVIRSGSVFPAMVFHSVYNGLEVLRGTLASKFVEGERVLGLLSVVDGQMRYSWLTLGGAVLVLIAVAVTVLHKSPARPAEHGS